MGSIFLADVLCGNKILSVVQREGGSLKVLSEVAMMTLSPISLEVYSFMKRPLRQMVDQVASRYSLIETYKMRIYESDRKSNVET